MVTRTRGIITEADKQKFIKSIYDENMNKSLSKEIEINLNTDLYDKCPYCGKVHIFKALGENSDTYMKQLMVYVPTVNGKIREVSRTFMVSTCANTGKHVYFWFEVSQEGDILTGTKTRTNVHVYKEEDILASVAPTQPVPAPEPSSPRMHEPYEFKKPEVNKPKKPDANTPKKPAERERIKFRLDV